MSSTSCRAATFSALFGAFATLGLTALPAAADLPPSAVGVLVIAPADIPMAAELPGRISATRIAEVRPQVGGIVVERRFEQGSTVAAGDVLFRLDDATYRIAVEAARAAVAGARASLAEARQNEDRLTALNARNIASRADLDTAVTQRLRAEAVLAEAESQLQAAAIRLDYTLVRAPIAGRIGRALITEGALVTAQGEVLTTIQQLDPVYADMQQPVSEWQALRTALAEGTLQQIDDQVAEVRLLLDNGGQYPLPGKLLFAESSVERTSGQIMLRAEFPNPDGDLLPGMYVRVIVDQATAPAAVAIPSQAVQRDASGAALAYVVEAGQTATLRPLQLGRSTGNSVIVEAGLQPGEMLVVDGFQKIGPGAPVAPVCWQDALTPDPAAAGLCAQALGTPAAVAN